MNSNSFSNLTKSLLYVYELHVITTSSCHLTVSLRIRLNACILLSVYLIFKSYNI